jgi:HEAT repeats
LIELYGKVSPECRPYIAEVLGGFGPDARKAVPLLILGLGETNAFDGEVGGVAAADALGDVHSEPQLSVPALIKCLSSQNPSIRRQASTALAHFGADAKPAVPTLINLLNDSAQRVKDAARDALKAIDPEAAEKAGVK